MLQFITNPSDRMTIEEEIQRAVDGGCKWVQLRMKDAPREEIVATAKRAKEICKAAEDCILVIDDYVDIAKELELDGVHLGKNDMDPTEARELLGGDFIIGATANTFDDIQNLRHLDIDYIGLGPMRFTTTKKRLSPVLGLEGYRDIISKMKAASINLPVVAIGGITYDDIEEVMATGVRGIAVSGSLINADDMTAHTAEMISLLEKIVERQYLD